MSLFESDTLQRLPSRPHLLVDVVMRRERVSGPMSRWQPWRWVLHDVMLAFPRAVSVQAPPQCLVRHPDFEHWLFPGFSVELHRDDAEGYYLNLSTPAPCWFVMWRMDEPAAEAEPLARPQIVTLSYHDAGRWLDAQETVEQVPAPAEVCAWLSEFVEQHHQPEPKRRQRPESFRGLQDRFGRPASISTEKKRGPGV